MKTIKEILNTINDYDFDFEPYKSTSIIRFNEKTRSEETKKLISESKMGIKQTKNHIDKRVGSMRGFKQSEYQKNRARETLECAWVVTSPEGQSFNIVNLRKFCSDKELDQGNMVRVSQGILRQHKGWKCLKVVS